MTLGIYIQVPFCQTKCTYCNFHTGVVSRDRFEPYADAVCREIRDFEFPSAQANDREPWQVDTIYFGGGTPSLLAPAALERMLRAVSARFDVAHPEVTLEADPETIAGEKASAWLGTGYNRISLGSQSFSDAELAASGRMHRRADISRATEALRTAGFTNISMDLIAGLPHQTAASWEDSLDQLLAIRPEHVSIYMLEIDEGSRLGRESLAQGTRYSAAAIPPDDAIAEFYDAACARLAAEAYDHYEISNWALPQFRSRHNLKYWRREPYVGFGAGAHSFDGVARWANQHDSAQYVAAISGGDSAREQFEPVTARQALDEEIFLGLRQLEGIDLGRIERVYHVRLRERITALRESGLVEFDGERLRLAPDRLAVSNEVFVELLG
jgi:oxygen-independent coproporphyrinogen-3 oxidase